MNLLKGVGISIYYTINKPTISGVYAILLQVFSIYHNKGYSFRRQETHWSVVSKFLYSSPK